MCIQKIFCGQLHGLAFFVFLNKQKCAPMLCRVSIHSLVCITLSMYNLPSVVLLFQVVPLSQRSGVLEWCSGTIPIGEFLVNAEEGAHKRYRPKDYSGYQCHKIMLVSPNDLKKYQKNSWVIIFAWGGWEWNLQRTMYCTFSISNNEYDQWHGINRFRTQTFSSVPQITSPEVYKIADKFTCYFIYP